MVYISRPGQKREALYLHPHDFLIGADNLVAHLEEKVHGKLGLLGGQNGRVEFLAISSEEALHRLRGILMDGLHLLDGARQHVLESAATTGLANRADGLG